MYITRLRNHLFSFLSNFFIDEKLNICKVSKEIHTEQFESYTILYMTKSYRKKRAMRKRNSSWKSIIFENTLPLNFFSISIIYDPFKQLDIP